MKNFVPLAGLVLLSMLLALSSCAVQDDKAMKPAAPPAPAPVAKGETKTPPPELQPAETPGFSLAGELQSARHGKQQTQGVSRNPVNNIKRLRFKKDHP